MATQRVKGAKAVILSLLEEEVDTIFGYPGGAIMPIYDALYDYDQQINHILTRHEQGAVHAAEGYAKVTGKAGVVFATSGPGATNLLTGIADAQIDSVPLVCITGQVASPLLGTDAFQESDMIGLSMPVTKWNYQISSADEIPLALAKAFYIAQTGRPGPVLIDIAKDAQLQEVDFEYTKRPKIRSYVPEQSISIERVNEAAQLINAAKKPLLLVGQGVIIARAEQELLQFIEKTGMPAACTLLGLSAIPSHHPLHVGMLGMHGNYGPNIKTNEADLLLAVGMRFDDRVTGKVSEYGTQAKVIHIEIDPAEINKIIRADVGIVGNAKKVLPLLSQQVLPNKHETWLGEFRTCDKIEHELVIEKAIAPKHGGLTMGEVVQAVSEKAKHDAVLVTDVGQQQMIASRYFKFTQSKSSVTSGGLGTMGFGLPASIGAQIGAKNRTVVCFVGDGGFQMTLQELGTIVQNKLPIKIIILNNNFLGMVRQWQELFFDSRYSFTELQNPDFVAIARGFGMTAQKVESREELPQAVECMMTHQGPFLLEAVVQKEENVFPMVPSGASVSDIMLKP